MHARATEDETIGKRYTPLFSPCFIGVPAARQDLILACMHVWGSQICQRLLGIRTSLDGGYSHMIPHPKDLQMLASSLRRLNLERVSHVFLLFRVCFTISSQGGRQR